jgi:hypothetical protein
MIRHVVVTVVVTGPDVPYVATYGVPCEAPEINKGVAAAAINCTMDILQQIKTHSSKESRQTPAHSNQE